MSKEVINISTREFIEKEIRHLNEKLSITFAKNDDALKEAKAAMNERLGKMNEFREQLNEQSKTFLTRDEYCTRHELINNKLDSLSKLVYIGFGIYLVLQLVLGGLILDLMGR